MRKAAAVAAGLLLAFAIAAYLSRDTWTLYVDQQTKAKASEARMRAAEEERAKLMNEKARLDTPVGREEAARKLGYRKPGEHSLPPTPTSESSKESLESP